MLDMGFRPAVDRIVAQCPKDRQTVFFSATLDGEAGRIAQQYTTDARQHEHVPAERKTAAIEHRFLRAERDDRLDALVRELRDGDRDLALVFVRTKRGADRLVKRLGSAGVRAVAMHGNKSQNQRERALAEFTAGKVATLVATDVAARGIDIDDITHVINYQIPEDEQAYVHRIGRTGRAGKTGIAVTLVDWDELPRWTMIDKALGLNTPDPAETYSSSPHLYEELNIPAETTGTFGEPRKAHAAKRPPAEKSADRPARNRNRNRRRTRAGEPVSAHSPAPSTDIAAPDAEASVDGAPKRRRRRRPRTAAASTG
jgi:superfamily II DNA/RNA helicase